MYELAGVERIVDGNLFIVYNDITEHEALLFLCGGPMQAGRNQDRDFRIRVACPDLGQQNGQRDLTGHGTSVVLFPLCQLAQTRRADGMLQSVQH